MMNMWVSCIALLSLFAFANGRAPIWKVFCAQDPIFRGRADPIVEPGKLSQHSHKVFGASNFGIGDKSLSAMEYFDHIRQSSCTSCSISIDLSNYWISDLYYEWENGSFSLVPNGGMTIYYLSRAGSGEQANPDWQPFPDGLRMTSGSPLRRSYSGTIKEKAISYACLGASGPETPYFPTNASVCTGGLRAQVWFPMCWDGVNLDSPNHQDHMSHPIERPDGGNCPSTHPVRIPGVFFEVLFDVNPAKFPHGNGRNPFRWANGDPTGYGLHGDFLNGWDKEIVKKALADTKCDNGNPDMAFGNNVRACPALAPFVKSSNTGCMLDASSKVNTTEDLGVNHLIDHMPGCNPLTYGPQPWVACFNDSTPVTLQPGTRRVLIKPASKNMYVSSYSSTVAATPSVDPTGIVSYSEVFLLSPFNTGYSIFSEGTERFLTAANSGTVPVIANKGSPDDWETFDVVNNTDGTISIRAQSNNKFFSLLSNGNIQNNAVNNNGTTERFVFVDVNPIAQAKIEPQPVKDKNNDGSGQERISACIFVLVLSLIVALFL